MNQGVVSAPSFFCHNRLANSARLKFSRVHPKFQPCSHVNQEVVLDRLKTTVITAFVIALLLAPAAFAQATAAKVEVVSGNGQLVCPVCAYKNARFFYPMVVKVTDNNGNPIAGKTVNWRSEERRVGKERRTWD